MKEPYRKGVAHHPGPKSGAGDRKAAGEAKDRGTRRPGIELRNHLIRRADPVTYVGRPHRGSRAARNGLRGQG